MGSSAVLTMTLFQAVDTSRFTCSTIQKREFLPGNEGPLDPSTAFNPYLGGRCTKKWSILLNLSTFPICLKLHFGVKITFGGSPEVPGVPGGAPCRTDMDCIEWVNVGWSKIKSWPKWAENKSKRCFKLENHLSGQTDISSLSTLTLSVPWDPEKCCLFRGKRGVPQSETLPPYSFITRIPSQTCKSRCYIGLHMLPGLVC